MNVYKIGNQGVMLSKWFRLRYKFISLLFGVIIGTSIALTITSCRHMRYNNLAAYKEPDIKGMDSVFRVRGVLQEQHREPPNWAEGKKSWKGFLGNFKYRKDNAEVANKLKSDIRIVCWVWCTGRDIFNQTQAIHKTWGRKCNKLIFFTDVHFKGINSVVLSKADVAYSTSRYIMAYRYIHKHYYKAADWFFGTFDETFVCMENLRLFLSRKNFRKHSYYGHKLLLEDGSIEFVDARVGIVMSKAALERLSKESEKEQICNQMIPAGEKQLGACLNKLGVELGNSTDSLGRSRFLSFSPSVFMRGSQSHWFQMQNMEVDDKGTNTMSKYAITVSGITSFFMYGIEYYLYHLRPFGLIPLDRDLNMPEE